MHCSTSYTQLGPHAPKADRTCWRVAKIVLRCFSITVCVAIISIEVTTLVEFKKTYNTIADIAYFATPPALLAIIWDKIEFLTLCTRRGRGGVHPGAHVAMELVLWLACCGMGGLILRAAYNVGILLNLIKAYFDASDDYTGPNYGSYTNGDIQGIAAYVSKAQAAGAMLFLIAFLRLILFVRACVEVDRRRKTKDLPTMASHHTESQIPQTGVTYSQPYDPVVAFPDQPPPYQPGLTPGATIVPYPSQQHHYPAPHRYPLV